MRLKFDVVVVYMHIRSIEQKEPFHYLINKKYNRNIASLFFFSYQNKAIVWVFILFYYFTILFTELTKDNLKV
jgi:hypothetical protein